MSVTMCARCQRTLLTGEQFRVWHAPEQPAQRRAVCALCSAAASAQGWRRDEVGPLRENAVGARATVRLVA